MGCGYKKMHSKKKRRKYSDFSEAEDFKKQKKREARRERVNKKRERKTFEKAGYDYDKSPFEKGQKEAAVKGYDELATKGAEKRKRYERYKKHIVSKNRGKFAMKAAGKHLSKHHGKYAAGALGTTATIAGLKYLKNRKKKKKAKSKDFNEYENRHNPANKHYRGTKGRRFERMASEIVDERQDSNRRKFMRAEKRMQRNRMASMRTRHPNFSEINCPPGTHRYKSVCVSGEKSDYRKRGKDKTKRCPKGMRMTEDGCQTHRKGDPTTKAGWQKRAMQEAEHNRKSLNPIRRFRQYLMDRG